jgi:hypothetical protein
VEEFHLKNLTDVEIKEGYQVKVSVFANFENMDANVEIDRAWKIAAENMKHLTEAANSMFRRRLLKTVSSKEED